jgi:pSer/pThr/pTyr-binding forkhead associated (FHA) protein
MRPAQVAGTALRLFRPTQNVPYMAVTLRILRGTLKDRRGNSAGNDVLLRTQRFTIGRALDCHLRCSGALIDSHHCLIWLEADRIVIRDFDSQHGTYLNGTRIDRTACLFHGDRLRVGRLEFEIVVDQRARSATIEPRLTRRHAPRQLIVPMRDTVLESVARRLDTASPKLNRKLRLPMPRSRESAFPRQS